MYLVYLVAVAMVSPSTRFDNKVFEAVMVTFGFAGITGALLAVVEGWSKLTRRFCA